MRVSNGSVSRAAMAVMLWRKGGSGEVGCVVMTQRPALSPDFMRINSGIDFFERITGVIQ